MRSIGSWLLLAVLTVALLEIGLRVLFPAQLGDVRSNVLQSERKFYQRDPSVGWSSKPGVQGTFTNGAYRGRVHMDARGARQNAAASTWDPRAPTIFLIGDSNAAGLEVDDEESLSARIEQRLRGEGKPINVLNLGVRDYGTDQAVLRAQLFRDLHPRTILYLFTNNDPFDNNLLHLPGRAVGKGVFIRRNRDAGFTPYNYPVPEYPVRQFSVVLLDRQCEPVLKEPMIPVDAPPALGTVDWATQYLWTLRIADYMHRVPFQPLLEDPLTLVLDAGRDSHPMLFTTYHEQGQIRSRCYEYFEAQMAAILKTLRGIPSVERVFVAMFPDNEIFDDLAAGRTVPSARTFDTLVASGVIDGYVNLSAKFVEAGLSYPKLACPGDGHLCRDGIAWEAEQIVRAFGARLSP